MTDKASPPLRFQTFSVRAWRPLNGFWEVGGAARGPLLTRNIQQQES